MNVLGYVTKLFDIQYQYNAKVNIKPIFLIRNIYDNSLIIFFPVTFMFMLCTPKVKLSADIYPDSFFAI